MLMDLFISGFAGVWIWIFLIASFCFLGVLDCWVSGFSLGISKRFDISFLDVYVFIFVAMGSGLLNLFLVCWFDCLGGGRGIGDPGIFN